MYRTPVVPKSLGTWYSSVGSHHTPLNVALMYCRLGSRDMSSFWRIALLDHARDVLRRGRGDVVAGGAALELGDQDLVVVVDVVRERLDPELLLEELHVVRADVRQPSCT